MSQRFVAASIIAFALALVAGACNDPDDAAGDGAADRSAESEPVVADAVEALAAAFDDHPVVAIGETHGNRQLHEFLLALLDDDRIRAQTHTLAVEVGSTAQPTIDAYVAGSASDDELLAALRDAIFSETGGADPAAIDLYRAARDANRMAGFDRWRIVAVDSALSWREITEPGALEQFDREADMAAALGSLVDAGETALWVVGGAHLHPGTFDVPAAEEAPAGGGPVTGVVPEGSPLATVGTARGLLDAAHPGATFVVSLYTGFGSRTGELEQRLGALPVPSVVEIAGSWLADLADLTLGSTDAPGDVMTGDGPGASDGPLEGIDGLLYLGACAALEAAIAPREAFTESYRAEIDRRRALAGRPPFDYDEYRDFAETTFGGCTT